MFVRRTSTCREGFTQRPERVESLHRTVSTSVRKRVESLATADGHTRRLARRSERVDSLATTDGHVAADATSEARRVTRYTG